jgi:hypothetical protein
MAANTDPTYPRQPWFGRRDAEAYGVVLDGHRNIAWGVWIADVLVASKVRYVCQIT